MKIIDFTHVIEEDMTCYCEEERVRINVEATIEKDKYESRSLSIFTHTGTHIDSPRHMLAKGRYIDEYSLEELIGKAIVLNLNYHISQEIDKEELVIYENDIKKAKFVLINTGWSRFWKTDNYLKSYPTLNKEAAKYLASFSINAIGIDCISIGRYDNEIENHKIFLENDILIIENLKFEENVQGLFELIIAPIKIKNSDGAPVRVFGIF